MDGISNILNNLRLFHPTVISILLLLSLSRLALISLWYPRVELSNMLIV